MKNKLLVAVFALMTFTAMVYAYSWGVANIWYFNASYYLDDWSKAGKIEHADEYQKAWAAISKSVAYDPSHPHYLHIKGRILQWGINENLVDAAQISEVKALFLASTQARSAWPIPWIDLAHLNASQEGMSDETWQYIHQALAVGPYEQAVNQGVLNIMMAYWYQVTPGQAPLFFEQFAIAVKQPKMLETVLKFSQTVGRKNLICPQLRFNQQYETQRKSHVYKKYCLSK